MEAGENIICQSLWFQYKLFCEIALLDFEIDKDFSVIHEGTNISQSYELQPSLNLSKVPTRTENREPFRSLACTCDLERRTRRPCTAQQEEREANEKRTRGAECEIDKYRWSRLDSGALVCLARTGRDPIPSVFVSSEPSSTPRRVRISCSRLPSCLSDVFPLSETGGSSVPHCSMCCTCCSFCSSNKVKRRGE